MPNKFEQAFIEYLSQYKPKASPLLRVANSIASGVKTGMQIRDDREEREFKAINRFESSLDRKIQNATIAGQLYSDSGIDDLRNSLRINYNSYSDKHSSLRSEFTESLDARIDSINNAQRKNKEWNFLETEAPLTDERLLGFTNDLFEKEWDEMEPADKLALKTRLINDTQKVGNLKRILIDDYHKGRPNYTQLYEEVSAIGYSKLALLSQIRNFDPGKTVITQEEMQGMVAVIKDNDPTLITDINKENMIRSSERKNKKEQQIEKNIKLYESIALSFEDPLIKEDIRLRGEEASKIEASGKIVPKDHYLLEIGGEWVDLIKRKGKLALLESDTKQLDEDYRMENILNASYSESFGVKFPFKEKDDGGDKLNSSNMEILKSLLYTDDDIKDMGYNTALDIINKKTKKKIIRTSTDYKLDASNIMDKYLDNFTVMSPSREQGKEFASEYNLSRAEMKQLSNLRNSINTRNEYWIDRNKETFTKLYTKARTPRELSSEQLLRGYVVGGLSAEEVENAKKEYPNIEQIKRDFQKVYPKQREQTSNNFITWYSAGKPKLIQKKRGAI